MVLLTGTLNFLTISKTLMRALISFLFDNFFPHQAARFFVIFVDVVLLPFTDSLFFLYAFLAGQ